MIMFCLISCLLSATSWSAEPPETDIPDLISIKVLDLLTAQRIALRSNPGIQAAGARLAQARAAVDRAKTAWWPRVDATGSLGRIHLSDTEFAVMQHSGATDPSYNVSSAGIAATWVLFDGFYRSFQLKQLEWGEKFSRAARRDSQRLLLSAVAKAFLNVQLILTRIHIAQADKKFYEQQLQDAANRLEIGTGARGPVLNFRVQLNSVLAGLLSNTREHEAATYGLAALLGFPDGMLPETIHIAELDRDIRLSTNETADIESLIDEALTARPDLRALVMQAHQTEALIGAAKSKYWPEISMAGRLAGASQGDFSLSGDDVGHSISVNLAWNLYSAGASRATIVEAEQRKREVALSLTDLRNQLAAEIRQEAALVAAARDQVDLQRKSIALVEENRQLALSEYNAGAASVVRLNEAQRDLSSTYGRFAQALVNYQLARQRLYSATGRNLQLVNEKE